MVERMLKWFEYDHLEGDDLKEIASRFSDLAIFLMDEVQSGPERTVALRKLLEAKDAAVRAAIYPGG